MEGSAEKYILIFLMLIAVFFRFWGISDTKHFIFDEGMHVPGAVDYYESGHQLPDTWHHPPLKHLLLYANMKIFGNNPFGWRSRNAFFGCLSVLLLVLLGRELFADRRVSYIAGAFLAADPLHIFFSRTTQEEIFAAFFLMAALYALMPYIKKSKTGLLPVSGLFLGLAVSSKWYYLLAWPAIICFTLFCKKRDRDINIATLLNIFSSFVLIPLSVYLLTFYAWFGRGYNLQEFIQMQTDAYHELQSLTPEYFSTISKADTSSPYEWFIKPVILLGHRLGVSEGHSQYHILMNNFPAWMLLFPSLSYALYKLLASKDRFLFLVLMLFISIYIQCLIVRRPLFLYSALSVLPFAFLIIAFSVVSLLNGFFKKDFFFWIITVLIIAWGLYLFPLATGFSVPDSLYAPLLSLRKV